MRWENTHQGQCTWEEQVPSLVFMFTLASIPAVSCPSLDIKHDTSLDTSNCSPLPWPLLMCAQETTAPILDTPWKGGGAVGG